MAGLISDIGSICKTVSSPIEFGKDILDNVKKSLGIADREIPKNTDTNYNNSVATSEKQDIRGISQVFRTSKYVFKYGRDFKCFNDDFYFKTNGKNYKNEIQDVQIYEFQPFHQTQLGTVLRSVKQELSTDEGKVQFAKKAKAQIAGLATNKGVTRNKYIKAIAEDPTTFYTKSSETDAFSQLSLINQQFKYGKWLNQYILPILDAEKYQQEFYLGATYPTWKSQNSSPGRDSSVGITNILSELQSKFKSGDLGGAAADATKMLKSPLASSQGTLLKTPKWLPHQGASTIPQLVLKLYLLNDTSVSVQNGWIFRNYKFMQNFITGTMPVSMYNSVMQPPNLYRVLIPGKVYFHWASIQVKAVALGKQKKIPEFSKILINKPWNIKSITQNTLWPQVWELTITITDLMPMSFTTYADYLMTADSWFQLDKNNKLQKRSRIGNLESTDAPKDLF